MKTDARVKAVESNHMEASLWKTALVLQHVVEVLQMTKGRGGGKATDQHQRTEQSTIRGARERGVAWRSSHSITPNHGWIGDSQQEEKEIWNGFSTHLVMSPTQHNVGQPAVRLVHPAVGRVHGVSRVWVVLERLRINNLFRKLASHDERIPDDVPLTLGAKEEQKFSQIVDEAGYLHPLRLSVSSNGLGSLQQMFDL
jgi:hypothetical protein